jgi:guanylate kinase
VIIIFDGPRGVGKDAIISALISRFPTRFKKIVTNSTRQPRAGEVNGVHHFFIDEKTFLEKVKSGEIFEYTHFFGTYRGMSKSTIDAILKSGKTALVTCDIVGVRALRGVFPGQTYAIFVTADRALIESRLEKEGGADIEERLLDFDVRHSFASENDCVIKNNGTLEDAVLRVLTEIDKVTGGKNGN